LEKEWSCLLINFKREFIELWNMVAPSLLDMSVTHKSVGFGRNKEHEFGHASAEFGKIIPGGGL
jgi:hypothetical protein